MVQNPIVTITGNNTISAVADVTVLADNTISDITLRNAGAGYTAQPTVTIAKSICNKWCW